MNDKDKEIEAIRQNYIKEQQKEDERRLAEYKLQFRSERQVSASHKEFEQSNQRIEEDCRKDIQRYYAASYYDHN